MINYAPFLNYGDQLYKSLYIPLHDWSQLYHGYKNCRRLITGVNASKSKGFRIPRKIEQKVLEMQYQNISLVISSEIYDGFCEEQSLDY